MIQKISLFELSNVDYKVTMKDNSQILFIASSNLRYFRTIYLILQIEWQKLLIFRVFTI